MIGIGEYLLIWSSKRDLTDPAKPLHTSFGLSKDGDFVGLFRPDEVTGEPVRVHAYDPGFPEMPPNVSYGIVDFNDGDPIYGILEHAMTKYESRHQFKSTVIETAPANSSVVIRKGKMGHGRTFSHLMLMDFRLSSIGALTIILSPGCIKSHIYSV